MGAVLGEHGLDEGGALLRLPGRGEHLGEGDLGVAARVAGRHAGDEVAERGDRRIGPALGEVEAGEGAHVGRAGRGAVRGGRRRRGAGGELGAGRLGAADLEQELGEGEGGAGIGRFPGRSPGVSAAARSTASASSGLPLRRCHCTSAARAPSFSGKRRFIAASSSPTAALSPVSSRRARRARCSPSSPGAAARPASTSGERAGGVLRLQAVGDEDEAGHDVAGVVGEDARRHRDRRRPASPLRAAAEVDGRLQRPVAGIGGVELPGARRVHGGGVEVPDLEGELGERGMGLGEVGPDVDELLVLGEGVAGRALVAEEARRSAAGPRHGRGSGGRRCGTRPTPAPRRRPRDRRGRAGNGSRHARPCCRSRRGRRREAGGRGGRYAWGRTPDSPAPGRRGVRAARGGARPGGGRAAARGKRRPPARA